MKLAVLFWCYKNVRICVDRVRHIRDQDPETPIYVLFGGELSAAPEFEREMSAFIDDFYAFDEAPPPGYAPSSTYRGGAYWKYMHGDLMWNAWYRDRGISLEWDSVVVVQWDMLIFGPVSEVFSCLQKDQMLLSGLRPIREVEKTWLWVVGRVESQWYTEFIEHVETKFGYDQDPLCCLAIVVCLPRVFLEKYSQVEEPEKGGLEYRLPIYAQIFGVPFCEDHPFKPWWRAVEGKKFAVTLTARTREIWIPTIAMNLRKRDGARVFHPYWRKTPRGALGWTIALVDAFPRLVLSFLERTLIGERRLRLGKSSETDQ